jgi:hypothetical protein
MARTLKQILLLDVAKAAEQGPDEVADWTEFEQRLVELVQACGGDYMQNEDPFFHQGFDLDTSPIPSPALLKWVYTVFHFKVKAHTGDAA